MGAGRGGLCGHAVASQRCCCSPAGCPASMGSSSPGPTDRSGIRVLLAVHRLRQPRRASSRNELDTVGMCRHSHSQWLGHYSLLHIAETAVQCLPAMCICRADGIQFLPPVQLQIEPELPAMPARGCRQLCLLSVLRNFDRRSGNFSILI